MAGQTVILRFLHKHRPYNSGEVAGFPADATLTKQLIEKGIAEVVPQDEVDQMREAKRQEAEAQADIDANVNAPAIPGSARHTPTKVQPAPNPNVSSSFERTTQGHDPVKRPTK